MVVRRRGAEDDDDGEQPAASHDGAAVASRRPPSAPSSSLLARVLNPSQQTLVVIIVVMLIVIAVSSSNRHHHQVSSIQQQQSAAGGGDRDGKGSSKTTGTTEPIPSGAVVDLSRAPVPTTAAASDGESSADDEFATSPRRQKKNESEPCPRYDSWLGAALEAGHAFAAPLAEVAAGAATLCLLDPLDLAVSAVAIGAAPPSAAIYVASPEPPTGLLLKLLLTRNRCMHAARAKHVADPTVLPRLGCEVTIVGSPGRWKSMRDTGVGHDTKQHIVFASSSQDDESVMFALGQNIADELRVRRQWQGRAWAPWPSLLIPPRSRIVVLTDTESVGASRSGEAAEMPVPTLGSAALRRQHASEVQPTAEAYDPTNLTSVADFILHAWERYAAIDRTGTLVSQYQADTEMAQLMLGATLKHYGHDRRRSRAVARVFSEAAEARGAAFRERLSQLQHRAGRRGSSDDDAGPAQGDGGIGEIVSGLQVVLRSSSDGGGDATTEAGTKRQGCARNALVRDLGCSSVVERISSTLEEATAQSTFTGRDAVVRAAKADPKSSQCCAVCPALLAPGGGSARGKLRTPSTFGQEEEKRSAAPLTMLQRLTDAVSASSPSDANTLEVLKRTRQSATIGCLSWWIVLQGMVDSFVALKNREEPSSGRHRLHHTTAAIVDGEGCSLHDLEGDQPPLKVPHLQSQVPEGAEVVFVHAKQAASVFPKRRLRDHIRAVFVVGEGVLGSRERKRLESSGFRCFSDTAGLARWVRATVPQGPSEEPEGV